MICNTGIGLIPRVDGRVDLFTEKGLYDGLFLMSDQRTGTYWNHMTGEALHGPLAGQQLELENVFHTTVRQVLTEDPDARLAYSGHPLALRRSGSGGGTLARLLSRIRGLPDMFPGTIAREDDRRPRMEMGIGIWSENGALYYPLPSIESEGKALLDTFGGRGVLIYSDPDDLRPGRPLDRKPIGFGGKETCSISRPVSGSREACA